MQEELNIVNTNESGLNDLSEHHTITYIDSVSGISCGSTTFSCSDDTCSHIFHWSSSDCQHLDGGDNEINVRVSSTNILGTGPYNDIAVGNANHYCT